MLNIVSLVAVLHRLRFDESSNHPSYIPIIAILFINLFLSCLLFLPSKAFLTSSGVFNEFGCNLYGSVDLCLSLLQINSASFIALDRYIVTVTPSWLSSGSKAEKYIGFLTTTFLLFFLIPSCSTGALYYSIIEHVKESSQKNRDDSLNQNVHCPWASEQYISVTCLICLLATTTPYLPYAIACLNPFDRNFADISYNVTPVILSRLSTIFAPIAFVWMNDSICKKRQTNRLQRMSTYHTITAIAEVPTISCSILAPAIVRRQLPKVPEHFLEKANAISP
ncbi:unnamed protein product [Dracunculus medinensis]|uniref:G_PROTEIN_RECEP_F1_2 domain-containing protein n=1 Tax=Dracunculus medinensis TaxID=318479 RepID=A0A3P7PYP4_DRAME|nr:unnamed protein product [Dracunculus medinensis]